MNFDFSKLKDSLLIVVVAYRHPKVIQYSLESLLDIIKSKNNTWVVLIDNNSDCAVKTVLDKLQSDKLIRFSLPFNFGRGLAANFFFKEYISQENLPKTIVGLDPDIVFSKESFDRLIDASENCQKVGMLGMRYLDNSCNPERNLFFKPKKVIGKDNVDYYITSPFMCTVAGGVFAIDAKKIFFECNNQLFPKEKIQVYGLDDSSLYAKLRWKYINGYLEGTQATHLYSGANRANGFEYLFN